MLILVVQPCKQDKPFYFANYKVISLLNSPVGRILQRWRCSCHETCCVIYIPSPKAPGYKSHNLFH